jgi:hypothetical protein
MSTNPIVITPSTSVVLVNTADYSGNPVVLLPNLAGPGALGRIITIRDNDGGSLNPAKSIYLSTTGGALFQPELSSITLSTIRITQPYGFITITPRLTDSLGNTNYGLMNVYAFPEASPAAYVNTLNANFSYLSTLSTANLEVSQNTIIQGNLTIGGSINYVSPGGTVMDIGRVNTNLISAASVINSNFYGVNAAVSTINTSSFVVRDVGAILMPNASSWSNAASFAGAVDANSLTLGNPAAGAGAQIGLSSNFFGIRSFTTNNTPTYLSTTIVMRDRTVGINVNDISIIAAGQTSNYPFYVRGATQMSNLGGNNNILLLKTAGAGGSNIEVNRFDGNSNYRIDSANSISEGFFGTGFATQFNWLTVDKNGSVKFWTGTGTGDTISNNIERVTIDNTGRVGIGKTAPAYTLDVSGELRVSGTSRLGSPDGPSIIGYDNNAYMVLGRGRQVPGGSYIDFDISASLTPGAGLGSRIIRNSGADASFNIINYGTGNLQFGTNGASNGMVIDASGRVGIGTTLPSSLVTIASRTGIGDSSGNPALSLVGGDFGTGRGNFWMRGSGNGQALHIQTFAGSGTDFTTNPHSIHLNPYGGNVGIGFGAVEGGIPQATLDTSGTTLLRGLTVIGTNTAPVPTTARLFVKGDTVSCLAPGFAWGDGTNNAQLIIQGGTDPNKRLGLGFDTVNNVGVISAVINGNQRFPLILQPNGSNVGIGTITPDAKLDISGGGAIIRGTTRAPVEINTDTTANVANIEIGKGRAADGNSYIDFVSETGADYNARIYRNSGGNASFDIINKGTGNINFGTQNRTTDMIIDSAGRVGIGITPSSYLLDVYGVSVFGGSGSQRIFLTSNEAKFLGTGTTHWSLFNSNYHFQIRNTSSSAPLGTLGDLVLDIDGGVSGTNNIGIKKDANSSYSLDVSGAIRASGDITAFSDARVKENINPIVNALEKIRELRGVTYTGIGSTVKKIGVIAQEIEKILPEVVATDDTPDHYKSVAYGNITALLIEGIKELAAKVDALEGK